MAEDKSVEEIQKSIDEANDKLLKSQEGVRKSQEDLAKAQEKANNSDESQELLRSLTKSTAEIVESNKRLEEQTPKILEKLTEQHAEATAREVEKRSKDFTGLLGKMRAANPVKWNAERIKTENKSLVNQKENLDYQKTLIEENGGVATANKKWRKDEKKYKIAEFKLQRKSATSRAGRKEIKQEEREI